ncbi:zinc finger CCCH domain-containing protein 3-like [Cynara cardunculus var. scolymus]|uniref:zinc finger CCCH domain-containing protein 3-like n=1 Tax=Cynara cardunculus var. scolymus TaxID=59895 RepID=UPI000D62A04F|nr:zinc finger CCCH domain-containing protein 3-like [Cynara cardunculus var. scolymus]
MPDNRRVQRNSGVSNSSLNPSGNNNIEEAIRRLRIQTNGKEDEIGSTAYPARPGEPNCIYYLRTGVCGYGDNCRFNHPTYNGQMNQHGGDLPERIGEPDCVYFLKTGACKYGSTCKYNHPRDRRGAEPIVLNMVGLPMRQGQKSCPHYVRTGSCKFGVTCKFHHPQPAPDGSNTPVSGSLTYGPSGAPPHINGSAWSYPSPQTYMPMVIPPAGINQGWSPYIANLNPLLSTNGSGSIDQLYPSTPNSHLPERPGEPECRYFMNTGACKYGTDCKYHHPREKMAQPAASSLSPLGLPLRPGQPACSYYGLYGICKYGPACKYDHPLVIYSYSYTMGMPTLPMPDPSFFPYGGMISPTPHSSDSSPSKSSKNAGGWRSEPMSNGKPCTDDSLPEHGGSSSRSSSQNQSD